MKHPRPRPDAFTMVEMLVVVAIIALLLAIILPALSGVQSRGKKMTELNNLRQIGTAWSAYANQNNDAAMPGYIDEDVYQSWGLRTEFPSTHPATDSREIPEDIAAPWTWRLLPFIDHNHEVIFGYRDLDIQTSAALMYDPINPSDTQLTRARTVAEEPAFAYNSFYVGGWWQQITVTDNMGDGGTTTINRPRFSNVREVSNTDTISGARSLVLRNLGSMKQPDELIIFTSGSRFARGSHTNVPDDIAGTHYVTPPHLAETEQWSVPGARGGRPPGDGSGGPGNQPGGSSDSDRTDYGPNTIIRHQTITNAPIGRYNNQVPILAGDMSTGTDLPNAIATPRRWIDGVRADRFIHTEDQD